MGFGTPPTPPVELEGDYSDWTIYGSFVDTDFKYNPYAYDTYAFINREETSILLICAWNEIIKCYDIEAKSLSDVLFSPYECSGLEVGFAYVHSVLKTYVAKITNDLAYVKILKAGAVVQTLNLDDLGLYTILACSVSPSGKYIVVGGRDADVTTQWKWVVLVGS